jgi:NADPH:quinone reductase-like Zn-dependent oxidoreductase
LKSIVYGRYGGPEVLGWEERPAPVPRAGEVLVRIRAASVNSWDWDRLTGAPLTRLEAPRRPKYRILGSDIAGVVEAVGPNCERFQPGDAVFGDLSEAGLGAFAEYVAVPETVLARMPVGLTFEQAAAIPQAGVLALQGLRANGPLRAGQRVLINGAGGGVGTFALQIARSVGAPVTGIDAGSKLDLIRALGADEAFDYAQIDFTRTGEGYDLILDMVARRSVSDYRRALRPGGTAVIVGGSIAALLQSAALGHPSDRNGNRAVRLLIARPNVADLDTLGQMVEAGTLVPVIDRVLPLAEAGEALRLLGAGQVRGKIVLTP